MTSAPIADDTVEIGQDVAVAFDGCALVKRAFLDDEADVPATLTARMA